MENAEILKLLGITRWHELGFKGKGVKVMSGELVAPTFKGVIAKKGYNENSHGDSIMRMLMEVCPEATFYSNPLYTVEDTDYMLTEGIDIFTTSKLSSKVSEEVKAGMRKCIEAGTTFFCAAGNKAEDGLLGAAKIPEYLSVGAIIQYAKENGLRRAWYSSIGPELDYVTVSKAIGTSFAVPYLAGQAALLKGLFKEKGVNLKREEMVKIFAENLTDYGKKGFDPEYGLGLFILPEPSTLQEEGSKKMKIYLSPSTQENNLGSKGYVEEEAMNALADLLIPKLTAYGIEVERNNPNWALSEVVSHSNVCKPDYHLAIHSNAGGENSRGVVCLIYANGGKAEGMANNIAKSLLEIQDFNNRAYNITTNPGLYELSKTDAPSVIVEVDFHDGEGATWIKNNLEEIASHLAVGILKEVGLLATPGINDWKIREYNKAMENKIITDPSWKSKLDDKVSVAYLLAMLNNLYEGGKK